MNYTTLSKAEKCVLICLAHADGRPVSIKLITKAYLYTANIPASVPQHHTEGVVRRAIDSLVTSRCCEWAHRWDRGRAAWATDKGLTIGKPLMVGDYGELVVAVLEAAPVPKSAKPTKWRQKRGRRG